MVSGALNSRRIEVDANPYTLYELTMSEGWGDGLPLLPPTEERVIQLLETTPHASERVIAETMHPNCGAATVEKIAVSAVMAGCAPWHFGYVVAGIEAITQPAHTLYGVTTTTGGAHPIFIINGPARDGLGFDYSYGCMGGATGRGQARWGRAIALCLRNIGDQRAGLTSKTCYGQPARFGLCFAEWEERSPWPSLAEQRGFFVKRTR